MKPYFAIAPDFDLVVQGRNFNTISNGEKRPFQGFDIIIVNPPFLRLKFLSILYTLLNLLSPKGMMISVNPANWFTEPLKSFKKRVNKIGQKLTRRCHKAFLIGRKTGNNLFGIGAFCDLGVFEFKNAPVAHENIYNDSRYKSIINKVQRCCSEHAPIQALINNSKGKDSPYIVHVKNLYGESSKFDFISQNGKGVPVVFSSQVEADNFKIYCKSPMVRNLHYMLSQNQHAQMGYIPVPDDLTRSWSDHDIANFWDLNKSEEEYMLRKVPDYGVKDYLDYAVDIDHEGDIQIYPERAIIGIPDFSDTESTASSIQESTLAAVIAVNHKASSEANKLTTVIQPLSVNKLIQSATEIQRSQAYYEMAAFHRKVEDDILLSIQSIKGDEKTLAPLYELLRITRTRHHRQLNALLAREAKRDKRQAANQEAKPSVVNESVATMPSVKSPDVLQQDSLSRVKQRLFNYTYVCSHTLWSPWLSYAGSIRPYTGSSITIASYSATMHERNPMPTTFGLQPSPRSRGSPIYPYHIPRAWALCSN